MGRNLPRSQLLLPGLLLLALVLFLVPDEQVNSLRGRALSGLSPLLRPFARFNLPPPGLASAAVPLTPMPVQRSDTPEAAPAAASPASESEMYERLKADYVRLWDAYARLQTQLNEKGLPLPQPQGINANVIARKVLWNESVLALDHGEADGVRPNAGVVHRGAAAGRIVSTGPHASTMALLTHRGMSITARLAECRVDGVMQGAKDDGGGERLCRMALVGRECPAKVGESVVTSGFDGAFPPGLWLGVVTGIKKISDLQWELSVRPACNENAVEMVRVLTCKTLDVPWPAMPKSRGR